MKLNCLVKNQFAMLHFYVKTNYIALTLDHMVNHRPVRQKLQSPAGRPVNKNTS